MTDKDRTTDAADVLGRSRTIRARIVLLGLLVAAYLGLEWISFLQEFRGLPVTPWNPGLGVLFAFMLARNLAYGWVLFASIAAAEFLLLETITPWYSVVLIAGIAALVYTAAAAVIRRGLGTDVEFDRIRDVVVLAFVGALASIVLGALLSAIFVSGEHSRRTLMLQLFIGDLVGIMVMTPLALRLLRMDVSKLRLPASAWRYVEALLLIGTIGAALLFLKQTGLQNIYVMVVPIVIVAARYGFDGACVAIAAVQFGLAAVLHAIGADAALFLDFQAAMLALTTAGLFVGAEVNARLRSEELARIAEARLQKVREASAQAERFSLVESMASALAHEINQPMTAVRALVRSSQVLIENEPRDLERASNNIKNAIVQIDHAADVLRRMRDFLKRRQLNPERVSVNDLLRQAPSLSRSQVAADIAIEAELDEHDFYVQLDRVQILQVLLNLIHNSAQAIGSSSASGGRIKVGATRRPGPDRVEFFVRDTGPGIPPGRRKHLFEPLRTMRGDGLGLGLAMCLTIVEAHGGQIWLESGRPGATEFRFWLPLEMNGRP